jgi:anaerobic selenocysteine-containing dehydrogenase
VVDQTFLVHPGSDGALALGLMHLLVQGNLIDHDFIATHVQGFEELKEKILPGFRPEKVSQLTGLSSGVIESMAKVWWLEHAPGNRSVNALTSQRLTDRGEGSTFYDNTVDVRQVGK